MFNNITGGKEMTLGELVKKYPKLMDAEIMIAEDGYAINYFPVKATMFGVDNGGTKIYLKR